MFIYNYVKVEQSLLMPELELTCVYVFRQYLTGRRRELTDI